ncbi:hypothetical protein FEM48_Zijuj01G0103000 [Ziziphus jujuba var. spinosa]|uniref:NB-ARC domain-containing protein n=1 Tax=Ziziphus jujuba var. spinosa TaxID=714518 RepID=A0A978W0P1_ZIZJJ|nr:hypothetical protein FEM48_Zijuj01G0103000 [Ziziphus jujuba var. spinosa]
MDVANFCKKSSPVYIYKLKPLPLDMSLELFCKKVFQFEYDQRHCPPELEELSHEILERCDGLPLAIVSIAGLLSTRDKIIHEWQKLNDSLNSDFESNPHLTSIARILSLSYNDLPHYFKSFFLYFGLYPEDYSIKM